MQSMNLLNSRRNNIHARFKHDTSVKVIPNLLEVLRNHRKAQGHGETRMNKKFPVT
jgi:hypothetical protein